MFNYYYFLGRKYGKRPNEAAQWAIEWVNWWDSFVDGHATTQSPR